MTFVQWICSELKAICCRTKKGARAEKRILLKINKPKEYSGSEVWVLLVKRCRLIFQSISTHIRSSLINNNNRIILISPSDAYKNKWRKDECNKKIPSNFFSLLTIHCLLLCVYSAKEMAAT